MVVFTCNHCGESLQKPKVEKHYFTICRRANKSLTCVDCLKDFLNEEYVAHSKCITEEERYAAKGSFSKGVVKKGEVKQESWTEVIQSVIEHTTNAKPAQQQILILLSNSTNVPRKKNKFMNFVKNALSRKMSDQDIGEVWNIIEKYKGQQAGTPTTSENTPEILKENLKIENGNQENIPADESTVEISKKRKKPKNLQVIENTEENKGIAIDRSVEELSKQGKPRNVEEYAKNEFNGTLDNEISVGSLKKKKKKAKNIEKNGTDDVPGEGNDKSNVEVAVDATAIETSEKKKKPKVIQENIEKDANNDVMVERPKKKKRKSKNLSEDTIVENGNSTSNIEVDTEPSKKKKKKSEHSTETDIALEHQCSQQTEVLNGEESAGNSGGENTKAKKRKLKSSGNDDCKESEKEKKKKNEITNNEETVSTIPPNNFVYKKKIVEILKTKNNISMKKLQKKILDAYQKVTKTEPSEKVIKKFNKHLKKISGIEISENNVRLINS